MSKFPCTNCGLCCRKLPPQIPHQTEGICDHLGEGNLCKIYEERPTYCRVEDMAAWYGVPIRQHFRVTAAICNKWIKDAGMDSSYLVRIGDS